MVAAAVLGAGCKRAPAAASGPPPYTLVLLYCGWESWIGNDHNPAIAASDPSHTAGALDAIKAALAQADLAHTAPPGSQGAMISFGDHVTVRVPRGPIAMLDPAALGAQTDYAGTLSRPLVNGLVRAVDELERAPAGRRVLVVLSDGGDLNPKTAPARIAALQPRIAALGIEVHSVVYKALFSGDDDVLAPLIGRDSAKPSLDQLAPELTALLRRINAPAAAGSAGR